MMEAASLSHPSRGKGMRASEVCSTVLGKEGQHLWTSM